MTAFTALNYIENGGKILVSLPGCVSSVFRLDGFEIIAENCEIGRVGGGGYFTPARILKHFQNMLNQGGTLAACDL